MKPTREAVRTLIQQGVTDSHLADDSFFSGAGPARASERKDPDMQTIVHGMVPFPPMDAAVDEVLDQALRLVADHHRTLGLHLGRQAFSPSIAELRQSPLGRDLRLLAYATEADPAAVRTAAARVRETLLRPMAADEYETPAWFWSSDLGRLVARAERAAAGPDAWLTAAAAGMSLGLSEAEVLEWAEAGMLPWLPDDGGRPLVARAAVERMRMLAGRIAPDRAGSPAMRAADAA